jgi:hypothetical protein
MNIIILLYTNRVTAVLLRRNSTNAYIFIARKLVIGLIIQYLSLNITGKSIIPKLVSTGTRTQDSFRVRNLSSCDLRTETNNFALGSVLLSCLVAEIQKPSSQGLEPMTDFRGYGLCSAISSLK